MLINVCFVIYIYNTGAPGRTVLRTDGVGETGASCNKINKFHYCTSVDCPFKTFMVSK